MEDRVVRDIFLPVEVSIMIKKCAENICSAARVGGEKLQQPGQHHGNMYSAKVAKLRRVNPAVLCPCLDDPM